MTETKIENAETKVTAESLLAQNDELRRQLSIERESLQTLTMSLAESNAEAELFGALQKLVRRVIDDILRVIERMNMKIDLDPIDFTLAHDPAVNSCSKTIEHEED